MENPVLLNIPKTLRHRLKCLAVQRDEPMYDTLTFCLDVVEMSAQLLESLETVFDLDWEYTKEHVIREDRIPEGQSFLYPGTDTGQDNWGNYDEFLRQYAALRARFLHGKATAHAANMA